MLVKLKDQNVAEIQEKYNYLVNYEADDPDTPIDPLTYVDSNGDYLLHIAAHAGDLSTVELLLSAGIDINQIGDMGNTALHYAYMNKKMDLVRLLLASGAATDVRNEFGQLPNQA